MSLKLIELQIAIPRTVDLGKMQEQFNNKAMLSQAQIAEQELKKEELKRKKVAKIEKEDKETILAHHESQQESKRQTEKHPYKGKNFDITG
ncbi:MULTISPECIES: hypothetical protein [Bacillus]|uniref:hypothetical protein n=1 Tax=Bacillus TaxID=1386 RepID=UPI000BB7EFF0|nr:MULTISPECIES: hypothetical protein [Bacillus]